VNPRTTSRDEISDEHMRDAQVVWDYHLMHHALRPTEAAIGLGGCDDGVAPYAAKLYHNGLFPLVLFSGGTSGATKNLYADGEAAHFRRQALELGVPDEAIIVEPNATNTGQNVAFSRQVLEAAGIRPISLTLIAMPYMERRAYATFAKQWPGVDLVCTSAPTNLGDYIARFEDPRLVISMMVGDLQRVIEYPKLGFAIEQEVPEDVHAAFKRLVVAGFDAYLLGS
jgi:uncharacterized SAM-binding protein YcdF (DUF218 family)